MNTNDYKKQTINIDGLNPLKLKTTSAGLTAMPTTLKPLSLPRPVSTLGDSFFKKAGTAANSFLSGGMGDIMGVGNGINNIFSTQGNTAQQQMQRGDAITDTVASGLSFIPGLGSAASAALKLTNTLGGSLISTPSFMKNYSTNQNVMQNSASFGGVADKATQADSTKSTFKSSGLVGKLIGKNKTSRNVFDKATKQQAATQTVLDKNTTALDNSTSSADMFTTRNLMNQQGDYFKKNITVGKSGLKFKTVDNTLINVLALKLQKGGVLKHKGLDKNEKEYWNGFVDYVKDQGYANNKDLNSKEKNLSRNLWADYGKTKGYIRDYDSFIPKVQNELKRYREDTKADMLSGGSVLKGYTKDQLKSSKFDWDAKWMPNLNDEIGLAGINTTRWKLPTRRQKIHSPYEIEEPKEVTPEVVQDPVSDSTNVDDSTQDPSKFKDGGSIRNVIVSGELHARKHALHDLEEFKDVKMTKKGVPVVVKQDGGTIQQTAEVEREELILHLELSEKIEKLQEQGDDEAAIEAGKILSLELTQNLVDNTDVLEKIIKNEED